MKKRTRIVSGLIALAALFLTPLAEASLSRVSAAERAIEASALSLESPALEPSAFSLFEGTELTAAAAEAERTPSFHPLAAVSLLDEHVQRELVTPLEPSYPKTRYRVFGLLGTPILGELRGVSLELRWGCASLSCGLSSGTVGWLSEDPLGPVDSPNLYGYVGLRPHEKTDPLGLQTPGEELDPEVVGRQLGFALDVGIEFGKGLDIRNTGKNLQRAAGGVVGAGMFVGKSTIALGSLAIDTSPLGPAIPGAIERNERRREAIKSFIAHPIDTIVNAHAESFEKILAAEQRGQYFSSGAEAGELGAAWGATATGSYGAARGVAGAFSRAASFGELTEAAGAGFGDYSAEVAGMTGRAATQTPLQIFQGVVGQESARLAANPSLARTVLSPAEYAAGQRAVGLARMQYGNALERLVAQDLAAPSTRGLFSYVGGPSRPDFVGRIGSPAVGMRFEVTTPGAIARHLTRPYGAGLNIVTYTRPPGFTLFP